MPKEKASLLGLGTGLLSWQGLSALADIVKQPEKVGLLPNLTSFVFGAVSIILIRTVTQLQTKGNATSLQKSTKCCLAVSSVCQWKAS